jgi:hypothetical protein
MTIQEVRDRLSTLRVNVKREWISAHDADAIAKKAAAHFGIPEQLVSVYLFKSKSYNTFEFCYNFQSLVRYKMMFWEQMSLAWVETCTLRLIGEILKKEHPNLRPEDIDKLFNK